MEEQALALTKAVSVFKLTDRLGTGAAIKTVAGVNRHIRNKVAKSAQRQVTMSANSKDSSNLVSKQNNLSSSESMSEWAEF